MLSNSANVPPLETEVCRMLGLDVPVFAFTHSREVVAAVSRAGGIGVLGAASYSPERIAVDLDWIEAHCDGKPYGVDLMIPLNSAMSQTDGDLQQMEAELRSRIPAGHKSFVAGLLDRFEVEDAASEIAPDGPPGGPGWRRSWNTYPLGVSEAGARQQLDVCMARNISLLVTALGPPPPDIAAQCRQRGIVIGALVGAKKHAVRQVEAGVDLIIAQGSEAAAHTGDISTMVLVPEIVDAVAPIPVLAAGGIGSGRQMAAALALGASGVWTGSMWLTSAETDEPPEVLQRLLAAQSSDTVQSRCATGKPLRQLRSPWTDAWAGKDSPGTLPMPLQHLLTAGAKMQIDAARREDLICIPTGQVIGHFDASRPAEELLADMVSECIEVMSGLGAAAPGRPSGKPKA